MQGTKIIADDLKYPEDLKYPITLVKFESGIYKKDTGDIIKVSSVHRNYCEIEYLYKTDSSYYTKYGVKYKWPAYYLKNRYTKLDV